MCKREIAMEVDPTIKSKLDQKMMELQKLIQSKQEGNSFMLMNRKESNKYFQRVDKLKKEIFELENEIYGEL